jgi:calcium/proton exchanger cax
VVCAWCTQVIVAWAANVPLGLDFHVFETTVCFATVLIVNFVIHDGESNWLQVRHRRLKTQIFFFLLSPSDPVRSARTMPTIYSNE